MSASSGNKTIASVAVAAGAVGLAAFAWGSLVERTRWTLRESTIPVLPAGADPIRVLHISDLHMAPWQRGKQEWVRGLAALKPDLVVNTGDNLGHVHGLDAIKYALEPFAGIPGVYVNGSNDYFGPQFKSPFRYFMGPSKASGKSVSLDTDALTSFFDSLGWANLNNRAATAEVLGTHIEFFGVDDPHRHYDRLDVLTGAIDDLRGDDDSEDEHSTLTIAVAHAPYQRVLNSFVNHGAQLMLAGHTHGGQVCVPGFGALVTNCDIPRQQVSGMSLWHHGLRTAYLNVSAGMGTSIYAPVRFACPPEASLLTLVAAP